MDIQAKALARQQAEICKVFSSPTRILILWALDGGESSVSGIASAIGASMQNTSQHLRLMQDRGIVQSRREGHTIYYRISNERQLDNCYVYQLAMQGSPFGETGKREENI